MTNSAKSANTIIAHNRIQNKTINYPISHIN